MNDDVAKLVVRKSVPSFELNQPACELRRRNKGIAAHKLVPKRRRIRRRRQPEVEHEHRQGGAWGNELGVANTLQKNEGSFAVSQLGEVRIAIA